MAIRYEVKVRQGIDVFNDSALWTTTVLIVVLNSEFMHLADLIGWV
jgi:hypothetical protein